MKNTILIIIVICISVACSKNNDTEIDQQLEGNWELIQMTGSISNHFITGSEMDWQETYSLKNNGTFIKTRVRDSGTISAYGTYTVEDSLENKKLTFTFDEENSLIANCSQNLVEVMFFDEENIFNGSWSACDGPGLMYEKED